MDLEVLNSEQSGASCSSFPRTWKFPGAWDFSVPTLGKPRANWMSWLPCSNHMPWAIQLVHKRSKTISSDSRAPHLPHLTQLTSNPIFRAATKPHYTHTQIPLCRSGLQDCDTSVTQSLMQIKGLVWLTTLKLLAVIPETHCL